MNGDDLIINGEIILEGTILPHEFCEWIGAGCFSARMVREALASIDGAVTIRVNSGGGDPYEGEAIRATLQDHKRDVRVIVQGVAASAASLMIMSAGTIEMSAGSFLMIHDPSSCMCGTADEHGAEKARLDVLADGYASVYAARIGGDAATVRAEMKAEIWLSANDAVARGYADKVQGAEDSEEVVAMAMAHSSHAAALSQLHMCVDGTPSSGQVAGDSATGSAGRNPAKMAARQEGTMPKETKPAGQSTAATPVMAQPAGAAQPATPQVATPPELTPTPDPAPATQMSGEEAVRADRARAREIRDLAQPFMAAGHLSTEQVNELIDNGTPVSEASTRMMTLMAATVPAVDGPGAGAARITRDETDTRVEGMIQAMMRNYEGPGSQFRGMRLKTLAMELAGRRTSFDESATVRAGMMSTSMMGGAHGVSDFSHITAEVMNRRVMEQYQRREPNWNIVTGNPITAADFRELHAVRFGGDFQLKKTEENGEYTHAVLADEAEGLKVERRGRTIKLTFEAIVNDDMGLFDRIPREFVMAARTMESTMVWSLIRTNAKLKSDNKAIFHADHKNLASSGGALSVGTVGTARKAMWEQTGLGSKDADDFLQIEADTLIVPPALEVEGLRFVGATVPTKDSDTNPYKTMLSLQTVGHLGAAAGGSDTAWYLADSDMPPIQHAYLEGYEAPTVQIVEGMNPRGVTMDADHIFGAAAVEFRGVYKNPGS